MSSSQPPTSCSSLRFARVVGLLLACICGLPSLALAAAVNPLLSSPDWLESGALPVTEPPGALVANQATVRQVFYDATTQNPTLIAPGELTPLPPMGEQPQFIRTQTNADRILQYLGYSKTVILGGAGDNMRFVDLGIKSIVALPAPTTDSPLLLTPGFIAHLITGPTTTDLPERLYESYIDFRWLTAVAPRFTLDLGFTPCINGDYAFINSKTWRFQARAIGIWTCNCTTQLLAGVAFIDRENIQFLPVAGLIWTPDQVWNFDLVVPRPRISRQLAVNWKREWRAYLGGEFGGNSFSILRTTGDQDVATYQDLRVVLGIERKKYRGRSFYLEAGVVFARKLEYASGTPSIDPGPSAMFQSGSYF